MSENDSVFGTLKLPCRVYLLKRDYIVENPDDTWVNLSEPMFRRRLKILQCRYIEDMLDYIAKHHHIEFAGGIAGYATGFHEINGTRCLVTKPPRLIEPVNGPFPVIAELIRNLFGEIQEPYAKCWLQAAVLRIRRMQAVQLQVMALAGPRNCGKNRWQEWIVTPCLGGRVANPYQYMTEATAFNDDLASAEHLMIADQESYTEKRVRDRLGDFIKQVAVNKEQSIHPKYQKKSIITPIWAMTISCNLGPRDLLVIPPLEPNVRDRLHLFKCAKKPMPMPVQSMDEKLIFEQTVKRELPMFLYHLLYEWESPKEILDPESRFPTRTYHNLDLIQKLQWLSQEGIYEQIIDAVLYPANLKKVRLDLYPKGKVPWEGTAAELQGALCDKDSGMRDQVMRVSSDPRRAGELLSKLRVLNSERFHYLHKKNGYHRWKIDPPAYWNGNFLGKAEKLGYGV